ncbi:Intraflagellar transport protein 172 [Diplonema papillatum]|nr:Intraflagellar transport protein 172 [Diplonema papillatum]
MQLRHVKTLQPAQPHVARVTASCWSPNSKRLAVADHYRFVHLFDENGEKRDKFSTKPIDSRGPKTYVVRGMVFSPDSSKLAIAQSDNAVFVYKLGIDWGEKKSICNKFVQNCPVTCVCWPHVRGNELLVFGVQDGKVRIGTLATNMCRNLYGADSAVVSIASSPDGMGLISGHADGSIHRYYFEEAGALAGSAKLCVHPTIPQALAWGQSVAVAGNDCKVQFYDARTGSAQQSFPYSMAEDRDFDCCAFNPSGHSLVVGAYDRLRVFNYNVKQEKWEEGAHKTFENLHSVVSLTWKHDGSRLVMTGLCGSVDMFDACIKRYLYKGKFEFTYVSHSQVIVKRLSTGTRIVLKSQFGYEIVRVNVYQDLYLVSHTPTTLLVGDLGSCKLSEVPWNGSGKEKFVFDNPQVCMVCNAGELSLIEYGRNEILGSCRTEHMAPHLLSVRVNDSPDLDEDKRQKIISYLVDRQTICILDLVTGIRIATIQHNSKIVWLELNKRATKLLFKDKSHQLFLYDIGTQMRATLLNYCTYVSWVPDSDVVVAQNRGDLCVWYSIDAPDRVAIVPIKGDVEDIERSDGKTEVIVDEGINTVAYGLDESLIEFDGAMEDKDYEKACDLLEQITITPETEAMWQTLSQLALQSRKLHIAERCYAALGDVAKARALNKIGELAQQATSEDKVLPNQGYDHYSVRAALEVLNKNFKAAEGIYLEHNKVNDAVAMWEELFRFDESIAVAEAKGHRDAEKMRKFYYEWLMETNQQDKAAELREREGKFAEAINLYLEGGLPARAAHVVNTYQVQIPHQQLEAIATALFKAHMNEKAGDFFEKLDMCERAIQAYRKGHSYRRAVDLSRRKFPAYVVSLEDEWGDWLVEQKQVDAAINHYTEAHQEMKAVTSAINARQWTKAIQILDMQDQHDPTVLRHYKTIATHYEEGHQFSEAEKYYLKAQLPKDAVAMYTRNNMWEAAHKVAKVHMSDQQIVDLYVDQARQLELQGKFKDAEQLYRKIQEPDLAIHMYKKAKKYDDMIRLVAQYRISLLGKTYLTLAQHLEKEGNYKQAENYYIQAKTEATGEDGAQEGWKAAVNMYRSAKLWEDAIRVAKTHGGIGPSRNVVIAWALDLGGDQGSKLLTRFGMVEQAIEYCYNRFLFDTAFDLASRAMPSMIPQVHLKHALYLEDEGHFKAAEDEFIKASKPKEAIEMYIHTHMWPDAMRVATAYEQSCIPEVLIAEAKFAFERKDYSHAERFLLEANEPAMLVNLYKEAGMHSEARRIAQEHAQHLLQSINLDEGKRRADESPVQAARYYDESGEWEKAVDEYFKVTPDHAPVDECVEMWIRCFNLCLTKQNDQLAVARKIIIEKLVNTQRYEQAAALLESIEDYRGAVKVYVVGKLWNKAISLAGNVSQDLEEYVQSERLRSMKEEGEGEELEKVNPDAGLEFYVETGKWEKAMALARRRDDETRTEVAAKWVEALVHDGEFEQCLEVVSKDGVSLDFRFYAAYAAMAKGLMRHLKTDGTQDLVSIRFGLFQVLEQMKKTGQPPEELAAMEKYLQVLHRYAMAPIMKQEGFPDFAAKLMVTVVRFAGVVPADKAFYDAGVAARDAGWINTAFVFLNRFLDISETQEEDDPSVDQLDNADFVESDIPFDFEILREPAVESEPAEAARQWVLSMSVDRKLEQVLPAVKCKKCSSNNWEGSVKCHSCWDEVDECIVSGYPAAKKISCKNCSMPALKEDWNKYVSKRRMCPWCNAQQTTIFNDQ